MNFYFLFIYFFRSKSDRNSLWNSNIYCSMASETVPSGICLWWQTWERWPWLWCSQSLWLPKWLLNKKHSSLELNASKFAYFRIFLCNKNIAEFIFIITNHYYWSIEIWADSWFCGLNIESQINFNAVLIKLCVMSSSHTNYWEPKTESLICNTIVYFNSNFFNHHHPAHVWLWGLLRKWTLQSNVDRRVSSLR